jgi:AcrR family transcriptional regulator
MRENIAQAEPQRPLLSDEAIAAMRRVRFTDALALECAERGYAATTMAHVVARAGTSRTTLYDHFDNKEEVFLTLLERLLGDLGERVDLACVHAGAEPTRQIEAGLEAVLDWVAAEPAAANAVLVEPPAASARAVDLQAAAVIGYAERLRDCTASASGRPDLLATLLVEGVAAILRGRVVTGEAVTAPVLLPSLTAFLVHPYLDD